LLVDADGYEIAVLTEETFNRAMVTPPVPWSLGWVDADGNPVLNDLSRDDVEAYVRSWADLSTGGTIGATSKTLARALRAALEADRG